MMLDNTCFKKQLCVNCISDIIYSLQNLTTKHYSVIHLVYIGTLKTNNAGNAFLTNVKDFFMQSIEFHFTYLLHNEMFCELENYCINDLYILKAYQNCAFVLASMHLAPKERIYVSAS